MKGGGGGEKERVQRRPIPKPTALAFFDACNCAMEMDDFLTELEEIVRNSEASVCTKMKVHELQQFYFFSQLWMFPRTSRLHLPSSIQKLCRHYFKLRQRLDPLF